MTVSRAAPRYRGNVLEWALEVENYLTAALGGAPTDRITEPQTILLAHLEGPEKATVEGLLLYDATQKAVVYSADGAWQRLIGGAPNGMGLGMVWRGTWSAGEYQAGDVVRAGGFTFIANKITSATPPTPPTTHPDWDQVA
jgi:hypothetical protein